MKHDEFISPAITKKQVTEDISRPIERTTRGWWLAFGFSVLLMLGGGYCVWVTLWRGIGMWGENKAVNWAWDITNFVWWIGIGHAGTFISAILLLFRSKWRNSINRSAETMTLAAIVCASLFVLGHIGRPWLVYWTFPLPNNYGNLWVNFDSALVWDAFAVGTYLLVSFVFWLLGLIPDFANLRDRATGFRKTVYRWLSFNWESDTLSWQRYESVMLTLAGLATALVISVHSIVAMDFATTRLPGWHSTIFPPYFVIGAIFSGFAMVISLLVPLRKILHLEAYITVNHFDRMNKMLVLHGSLLSIGYFTEFFMAYYSQNPEEQFIYLYRFKGDYSIFFMIMMLCNVLLPQLLWFRSLRRNLIFSFVLSILINVGMWMERFVIIVTSLSRDYLPSGWAQFFPTMYDVGTFVFSIGVFFFIIIMAVRFIPMINMSEVKSLARATPEFKRVRKSYGINRGVPEEKYSIKQVTKFNL